MELAVFAGLQPISGASLCHFSSKRVFYRRFFRGVKWSGNLSNFENPKHNLGVRVWCERIECKSDTGNSVGEPELIHVIAIGSRKDAVIDFCLDSPFQLSSSLRFWNLHSIDSLNVQLQERILRKDFSPRILEVSHFLQTRSRAIILVASAGFGLDHVAAIEILKTVRLRNGFTMAILLKPFSFEGQKRQDEVKDLVGKLQEDMNFCIDVDTDALLKKDLVTLDEALKTANNAVLLAINAISFLISETHHKLIDAHNNVKELLASEVIKILRSYKEAKIGFGTGSSIKSSILRALYDCPFIGDGLESLKGFRGLAICVVASSGSMNKRDINDCLHTFRQTTEYAGEIVISTAYEPNLERNVLVTTIVLIGSIEPRIPQESDLFSRLAQHIPFIFKILTRNHQQSNHNGGNNALEDPSASRNRNAVERVAGSTCEPFVDLNTLSSSNENDNCRSRESEIHSTEARIDSSCFFDQIIEGTPAFQREPLNKWNSGSGSGSGYKVEQEHDKERARDTPRLENLSIFSLPVGIRHPEESKESLNLSYAADRSKLKIGNIVKEQTLVDSSIPSLGALTDAGSIAVSHLYNNASILLKGRDADVPKKQGVLSVRAASMLEAERESPRKWSPIMEMQYRGGLYRGRCEGGLPEGKGRLIHGDGSIYEGMWRYGKRSGQGAFYFTNGDVFQGSWRDDMMHGKGWFYFHTGDRWFANFWKGKANGESRFYSVSGDVIFGHFQDGWRHGKFLCIDVDGSRRIEIWDEGILVSSKQLDSEH